MAGIGFDNAPNYRAYPGSFIGRAIAFYHVRFSDMRNSDGKLDQANFRKAVQVIQEGCEVMWVSVPYVSNSYGAFQVMVSYDTANTNPLNGDDIATRLNAALGDSNIVFRREYLVGSNWYTEDDSGDNFFNYCNSNYAKDDNGIPMVFSGVEQDEFTVKYIAYYA
jgi:hypothetical protein